MGCLEIISKKEQRSAILAEYQSRYVSPNRVPWKEYVLAVSTFPDGLWGAVCVKIQLHDFNNVSRCAVSYWYFQYQDAYSVILVFINTSVKSALCHTGIYKYQCQDA